MMDDLWALQNSETSISWRLILSSIKCRRSSATTLEKDCVETVIKLLMLYIHMCLYNAVILIADVRHIMMTLPWHLVASLLSVTLILTMANRDVLYNQCISKP